MLESVTEPGQHAHGRSEPLSLAELARLQGSEPVVDPKELTAPVWDSDEELDAFLADLRTSRDASVG
jgi:hypothetical protein